MELLNSAVVPYIDPGGRKFGASKKKKKVNKVNPTSYSHGDIDPWADV